MEITGAQQCDLRGAAQPNDELLQGKNPLQLVITRPLELDTCPFWVSLYKPGLATPTNLFDIPTMEGILNLLSEEGLKETQPLMLSENTAGKSPRQFYLVPESLFRNKPERMKELVVTTIEALNPPKAGLYISANQMSLDLSIEMIEEICLGLSFLRTDVLHLYTGKMGVNVLLNAALRVKRRLEGRREIFVYH